MTTLATRGDWSKASRQYLDQIIAVLNDLRPHWPLSLRQVYYQGVAGGLIKNELNEYKKLSRVLTRARLDGLVSWDAIEDRSRSTLTVPTWPDADEFISDEIGYFLTGYRRDLLQTQDAALEVWVEKDALGPLCQKAADPFGVPVIVAKGFSSVSYKHNCRQRVLAQGRPVRILYFGDLDPSGYEMLPSMLRTLRDEMGLGDQIEGVRCALNPEHVQGFNLPHDPEALKWSDTRARKYVQRFGELAVELDALRPEALQGLVRESIEQNLDLSQFEVEREHEAEDVGRISGLRARARDLVEGIA